MSVYYAFGFDVGEIGGLSMTVTDDGGVFSVAFGIAETFAHVDMSSVMGAGAYDDFAGALQTSLNASSAGIGTYGVSFNASTGYAIEYFDVFSIDLTGTDAQTNMARVLGFSGDRSGDSSYASQVRPYYLILPAIAGRSKPTDERQPPGVGTESVTDGGGTCQRARRSSEIYSDWDQSGEDMRTIATIAFGGAGAPVFRRLATAAIPWSYQEAWRHHKTNFDPFAVVDSSFGSTVHRMRAEGCSFKPARIAGVDIDLWSLPFRTRELGRIS